MADFNKAFDDVLRTEGGYQEVNDPDDPGGRTYAGVSYRWHPDWPGWEVLDQGRREELPPLVKAFYKRNFWDPIGGDSIPNQADATALYSCAVLSGVSTARRFAEQIGPCEAFSEQLALLRIARYCRLVEKNPKLGKYLRGWVNRALTDCARGTE